MKVHGSLMGGIEITGKDYMTTKTFKKNLNKHFLTHGREDGST